MPAIRDAARHLGLQRAARRRLPFQRPQAARRSFPTARHALGKYRINPGNVGRGAKRDEQFATMIETACRHEKPVRIGVNWGSLDQELLARMMDENATRGGAARRRRGDARSADRLGDRERGPRRGNRPLRRPHRPLVQGKRGAGPDRGVPRARAALRLPAAPRAHRGGHGLEGHRRLDGGDGGAAAGRHRRHDPRLPHAGPRRRPHARSRRGAGAPSDDGAALVRAAGDRLPGLRADHAARSSRSSRRRSRAISARRCRRGASATPASRRCTSR